jgi:hypothetical protein
LTTIPTALPLILMLPVCPAAIWCMSIPMRVLPVVLISLPIPHLSCRPQDVAKFIEGEPLRRRFVLLGTPGLLDIALAEIDMALWDAHARVDKSARKSNGSATATETLQIESVQQRHGEPIVIGQMSDCSKALQRTSEERALTARRLMPFESSRI